MAVVTRSDGIIVAGARHLTGQLLERLPLRLGDEVCGKEAAEHEEGEDLHHVVEPGGVGRARRCALLAQGAEDALGDDGADFPRGSRYAVGGRAVAGGEAFSGDDESGCVRAWRGIGSQLLLLVFFFKKKKKKKKKNLGLEVFGFFCIPNLINN